MVRVSSNCRDSDFGVRILASSASRIMRSLTILARTHFANIHRNMPLNAQTVEVDRSPYVETLRVRPYFHGLLVKPLCTFLYLLLVPYLRPFDHELLVEEQHVVVSQRFRLSVRSIGSQLLFDSRQHHSESPWR